MTEPSCKPRTVELQRLRALLAYDPETGAMRWQLNKGTVKAGDIAGSIDSRGYRYIHIDRRRYRASRLIWFHVHGRWPENCLDHINGCRDDNRLANLREATLAQNSANRRSLKNRPKGPIRIADDKWRVNFCKDGHTIYLGTFPTFAEAQAVYMRAAIEANGEFARVE